MKKESFKQSVSNVIAALTVLEKELAAQDEDSAIDTANDINDPCDLLAKSKDLFHEQYERMRKKARELEYEHVKRMRKKATECERNNLMEHKIREWEQTVREWEDQRRREQMELDSHTRLKKREEYLRNNRESLKMMLQLSDIIAGGLFKLHESAVWKEAIAGKETFKIVGYKIELVARTYEDYGWVDAWVIADKKTNNYALNGDWHGTGTIHLPPFSVIADFLIKFKTFCDEQSKR